MRKLFFVLFLSLNALVAFSKHITGGEMYYTLTGQSGNNYTYHVVLRLYRDCNAPPDAAPLDDAAPISIFDNATRTSVWSSVVNRNRIETLSLGSPSPCINNPPTVCYQIGYYEFDVTLPGTPQGYTITYQRCCRIAGINNLVSSDAVGATYVAQIPGTAVLPTAPANNSAHFIGADTVVVCAYNSFCYNFGATDLDNDSLVYRFCTAYTGGSPNVPAPNPPVPPNSTGAYAAVPYYSPFNENAPLGKDVRLDPATGMMCGIAPDPGIYVVTVCVDEYRNGKLIATQRKDLQIKIGNCSSTKPALDPAYITCNGYDLTFFNQNNNPLINTYLWSFGDSDTSTSASPLHTYADTGTYAIKLVVNKGQPCSDSSTALAKVYPGFFPGFTWNLGCVNKPTQFIDTSRTAYGFINSWSWNFGDASTNADTSRLQNPSYSYPKTGTNTITFIVTSNKGCIDTVTQDVTILDKPPLSVYPKDTLICNGDAVQLNAFGTGTFNWSPGTNILNANTPNPTVNPTSTTNYMVTLNYNGCIAMDTSRVRVVDFVSLQTQPDTVICSTDSVQLRILSNGLRFSWTPAADFNNATFKNPTALPVNNPSIYQVTATIGSCNTTGNITVSLVPYPGSDAGNDTIICYNSSAQLRASIIGNAFTWTPASSLDNPNSLNPIAKPKTTTTYILSVTDNLGCPKPKLDTVVVTVLPKINAFAGKDTSVVVGQPLQLSASGGTAYFWVPSTALNKNNVANPVGIYNGSFDSIRYKVLISNAAGCYDSAYITVRVFRTNPQIFVPTAFTPNGDGLNDYVRPIAVGISQMDYFRIYNRWGQLVFSSSDLESKGWDGKIGGQEQATGVFVWMVKGTDFTGKVVIAKGTVTLIR